MEALEADDAARAAYEADVRARPTYHDGTPRKAWGELSPIARWSWRVLNDRGGLWRVGDDGSFSYVKRP